MNHQWLMLRPASHTEFPCQLAPMQGGPRVTRQSVSEKHSKRLGSGLAGVMAAWLVPVFLLMSAGPGSAQSGCSATPLTEPHRRLIVCTGNFRMEIEPSVLARVVPRDGNFAPRAMLIENGGALIEEAPGSARTQIRTPHAIAAVRGTVYVVDVTATQTSVFVVEGQVRVRRTGFLGSAVRLGPNQGVDVSGRGPLEVKNWSTERITKLMARFGR